MFSLRRISASVLCRSLKSPVGISATSLAPVSSTFIVSRNMNFLTDMVSRVTTKTIDSTKEKSFNKMLDLMLEEKDWNLNAWKKMIDGQLNSWMMYIPGVASGKESDELKKIKSYLDAMTPEELQDFSKLDGKAKARISSATNSTIDDINMALFMFKNTIVIQKWVHLKKDSNEPMPASDVQMHKMMIADVRLKKISMEVMKPTKKTGRGRSLFK